MVDGATWRNHSAHLFRVGNDSGYDVVACTSWVYDRSHYTSTIVSRASISVYYGSILCDFIQPNPSAD